MVATISVSCGAGIVVLLSPDRVPGDRSRRLRPTVVGRGSRAIGANTDSDTDFLRDGAANANALEQRHHEKGVVSTNVAALLVSHRRARLR
jgi:hypothetical protein